MIEAVGTIIGERNAVLNLLFPGIFESRMMARRREKTTANKTVVSEKVRVFFEAMRKAEFRKRFKKF